MFSYKKKSTPIYNFLADSVKGLVYSFSLFMTHAESLSVQREQFEEFLWEKSFVYNLCHIDLSCVATNSLLKLEIFDRNSGTGHGMSL